MPAAHPRAALAAVAGTSSASTMAGLTSSLGLLQIARSARGFSSSSSSSSHAVSSPSLPSQPSFSRCSRQTSCLTSSSRRPVLPTSSPSTPAQTTQTASFSCSAPMNKRSSIRRMKMRLFYKREGKSLKRFDPDNPLYKLGAMAKFPYNPEFKVESILSDATRQVIWRRVVQQGEPVKSVAATLGIDMRRVAAAVRLKELERSWILQGKPLAKAYAKAISKMMPTVTLGTPQAGADRSFEPTNEISVHPYTQQQLFLPVSESRHFTRKDAALAFHPTMLPADKRMPIPQLIDMEKNAAGGAGHSYRRAVEIFREDVEKEQAELARREQEAVAAEEARTAKVETERFQFRIRDYDSERVGRTGRSSRAVGWRYGAPYDDRKRGLLKIPSSIG